MEMRPLQRFTEALLSEVDRITFNGRLRILAVPSENPDDGLRVPRASPRFLQRCGFCVVSYLISNLPTDSS